MPTQLPLDIKLDTDLSFENYYQDSVNAQVLKMVKELYAKPNFLLLTGGRISGKTHLLQAFCKELGAGEFLYVPASQYKDFSPEVLKISPTIKYVVLDDVDKLLGKSKWEQALFNLYNEVYDHKLGLLMSASFKKLKFNLADLESRFSQLNRLELPHLTDKAKREIFLLKARASGIRFEPRVVDFVLNHYSRNLQDMLELLHKLDEYSLQYKNKITINTVKAVLDP